MKLGLVAYLVCVFGTADAGPLRIVQTANQDFEAQVAKTDELRLDQIALEIDGKRRVAPWRIARSSEFADRTAVVVLVQGTEIWMGNDDGIFEDRDSTPGLFKPLRAALDRFNFARSMGYRMATYSDDVRWLSYGSIGGTLLGHQSDYLGQSHTALSDAIEEAVLELGHLAPVRGRRVLVVIGDGCDEASTDRRNQLRDALARDRIELFAVVYKSRASCDGLPIQQLTSEIHWVPTVEEIASTTYAIVTREDNRLFARFDAAKLPWDGELHEYNLIAGGERFGSVFRALPDRSDSRWRGWWWVALVGGSLAAISLAIVIRRWHRSAAAILR